MDKGDFACEYSFLTLDGEHTIADTVKVAEDGTGVIVRLYESEGCREQALLKLSCSDVTEASSTNLLEERLDELPLPLHDSVIELQMTPYKVSTVKLRIQR